MLSDLLPVQVSMPLPSGTRLGVYEVLAQIGAGGMGEVYKARDPKLDRLVAIKVLPSDLAHNPDFLARFAREAKAVAALNHPNILGIHDLVQEGDFPYAVMELLEGETLRQKLKAGPLPLRKALDISQQIAEGLAAAHAKGIIHRDIKPDNLFLTREGRVKVLDFGLAKQLPDWLVAAGSPSGVLTRKSGERPPGPPAPPAPGDTEAGLLLGTVGYMAPEQVRGKPTDVRSDIFAFAAVMYELFSGQRAFQGDSAVQVLHAILDQDPPGLADSGLHLPPALEQLIFHCLEKEPGNRFQSMRDVAYTLDNLPLSAPTAPAALPRLRRKAWAQASLGALAILGLGLSLGLTGRLRVGLPAPPPTFQRLSFAPGTVESACFGPDGKTVFFSARIAGARSEVFALHPGDEGSRPLGLSDALLLGVSPASELFLLRNPLRKTGGIYRGLLAQAPAGGGALKELQEGVTHAAWDAQGLAALVTLSETAQVRVEFPLGQTRFEGSATNHSFRHVRLSRDGQRLALVRGNTITKSEIQVYDRAGQQSTLYTKLGDVSGNTLTGLAWGPGDELWFSELQGDQTTLWALSPRGRQRLLWRGQGLIQLMDVSDEGRVLMASQQVRRGVLVQRSGEARVRDLSIGSSTLVAGLSPDGRQALVGESPAADGGTTQDRVYLRPTDGAPPVALARGTPRNLSSDGRWVQLLLPGQNSAKLDPVVAAAFRQAGLDPAKVLDPHEPKPFLLFISTGLDRPWALGLPAGFEVADQASLLPDGERLVCAASYKGKWGWYLASRRGGDPQLLTQEGFGSRAFAGNVPLSPDGTRYLATQNARDWFIFPVPPVPGQLPQAVKGFLPGERPLRWTQDGRSLFVRTELSVLPVSITRVDPATGARTPVQSLVPPDATGHLQSRNIFLTPDARTIVYDFDRRLSELYLVQGVR